MPSKQFTVAPSSRKFRAMSTSCPRRLSAWPSLLTAVTGTFSLLESQCISTQWTVILSQAHNNNPMFSPCVKIFSTKTRFFVHDTFFYKFYMVCTFWPLKIWWQTSVQTWSTLICFYFDKPQSIFLQDSNNICY